MPLANPPYAGHSAEVSRHRAWYILRLNPPVLPNHATYSQRPCCPHLQLAPMQMLSMIDAGGAHAEWLGPERAPSKAHCRQDNF
jgi:hypothetical protein